MTIQHNAITDPDIHEPKGVASATANQTYVADGTGSGTWKEPEPKGVSSSQAEQVLTSDGSVSSWEFPLLIATLYFPDIGTAGSVFLPVNYNCDIKNISIAIDSATDATTPTVITPKISGVAVTGGALTVPISSSSGDVVSSTPTSGNSITSSVALEFASDGGTSTTTPATISVALKRTA